MTHHSSTCAYVLKVLTDRVNNFKCMNVELQTLGDDNVRIASTSPQKVGNIVSPDNATIMQKPIWFSCVRV